MGISGNLKTMALAELLQWLSQGQKSGTLVIDNTKIIKRIFFRNGVIISSASTDPKEYLGCFLVSYGFLSEAEVNAAVARQDEEKTLIGTILVNMGTISEEDLHQMLRLKAEESIYDIFTWEEGEFRFLDGELQEETMIPMQMDVQWVVLEGSRRLDEWTRIREIIPSNMAVPVSISDLDQLDLDDSAKRILSWIDDDRTVEEISQNSQTSLFLVSQAIAEQVKASHLKVVRPRVIEVKVEVPAALPEVPEETGKFPIVVASPALQHPAQQASFYSPQPGHMGYPHPQAMPQQSAAKSPQASAVQQQQISGYIPTVSQPGVDIGGRTLHYASAPSDPYAAPPADPFSSGSVPRIPVSALPTSEAEVLLQQADDALGRNELDNALALYRKAKTAQGADTTIEQATKKGEDKVQQALERSGFGMKAVPKLKCSLDQLTQLNISPQEGYMLTRIDGSYDVQSLLKLSPMSKLEAQLFFWRLKNSGHIAV